MEEHLNIALAPAKAGAIVLGSFGTLALLLASMGLYGMMAYAVTQRTFEIGLRRALGARNVDVLTLIMTQCMVLVVGGLTAGVVISLAAARIMAGMLYGIDVQLNPYMGWNFLIPLFAATILGTIGNVYGALVGGLVIGVAQQVSTAFMTPTYKPAVAFIIMILILLIRPKGIFGGSSK